MSAVDDYHPLNCIQCGRFVQVHDFAEGMDGVRWVHYFCKKCGWMFNQYGEQETKP